MGEPCQSYRPGEQICRDGFFVKPICAGDYGCAMCGRIGDAATPWCERDELPEHWIDDRGRTRFRPHPTPPENDDGR